MRHPLYDIDPESIASLNGRAHPGGGTTTIEVMSGEGLIEDQFEAQLRGLEIAYKEPVLRVLASLADKLDSGVAFASADEVDAIIKRFADDIGTDEGLEEPAQPQNTPGGKDKNTLIQEAKKITAVLRKFLDNAYQPLRTQWMGQGGMDSYKEAQTTVELLDAALNDNDIPEAILLARKLLPTENKEMWEGGSGFIGFNVGLYKLNWQDDEANKFINSARQLVGTLNKAQKAPDAPVVSRTRSGPASTDYYNVLVPLLQEIKNLDVRVASLLKKYPAYLKTNRAALNKFIERIRQPDFQQHMSIAGTLDMTENEIKKAENINQQFVNDQRQDLVQIKAALSKMIEIMNAAYMESTKVVQAPAPVGGAQ